LPHHNLNPPANIFEKRNDKITTFVQLFYNLKIYWVRPTGETHMLGSHLMCLNLKYNEKSALRGGEKYINHNNTKESGTTQQTLQNNQYKCNQTLKTIGNGPKD
jgi:hypothetical protein